MERVCAGVCQATPARMTSRSVARGRDVQTGQRSGLVVIFGALRGASHLSWVVTAYLLSSTIAGPLYGKPGDLYGRKPLLQAAIVLFLTGSALCGLAQNMAELI